MKHIKSALLVMALMTPTLLHSQTTTNSIYIDQIGDGSQITIKQEGQGNQIGNRDTDIPVNLQGDGQTVDVTLKGNQNKLNGDIKQSDGSSTTVNVEGDNNNLVYDVGNSGDTGGSTSSLTVTGSGNDMTFNQGKTSSATGLSQTYTIQGDLNTVVHNVEADDVTNTVAVTGDSNNLAVTQSGAAGKNVDLTVQGSQNDITINQKSTLNVDSIKVDSTATGSTFIINQCNVSGC